MDPAEHYVPVRKQHRILFGRGLATMDSVAIYCISTALYRLQMSECDNNQYEVGYGVVRHLGIPQTCWRSSVRCIICTIMARDQLLGWVFHQHSGKHIAGRKYACSLCGHMLPVPHVSCMSIARTCHITCCQLLQHHFGDQAILGKVDPSAT